jgi:hypothetical protein
MQLVMKRERLIPVGMPLPQSMLASFKINARLVLEGDEQSLIDKYSLKTVTLTPGNPPRDRRKALLFAAPLAVIVGMWVYNFTVLSMPAAILVAFFAFLALWYVIYEQIREAVSISDLLDGRDFKARSMVQLLVKEQRIRKMSGVFAIVIEQARTWHEPEVIMVEPKPLGILLAPTPEGEYEVAGSV